MKLVRGLACVLAVAAIAGCGAGHSGGTGRQLTLPELKYRLIDQVGRPLYCGPPVVRVPTPSQAQEEVSALRSSDLVTFSAIVSRLHLDAASLSAADEVSILQEAEKLNAIRLQSQGNVYAFDYVASRTTPEHVVGTIGTTGTIDVSSHVQVQFPGPGGCPICLASTSRIATPGGPVPVTMVRAGTLVWTLDASGERVAMPVLRVGHTPAPFGHQVVRLLLEDGRTVQVSPGHPTLDGRKVGDLRPGDRFDGSVVEGADLIPYSGETWDLLPAGPSHAYWAGGILLSSTLSGTATA